VATDERNSGSLRTTYIADLPASRRFRDRLTGRNRPTGTDPVATRRRGAADRRRGSQPGLYCPDRAVNRGRTGRATRSTGTGPSGPHSQPTLDRPDRTVNRWWTESDRAGTRVRPIRTVRRRWLTGSQRAVETGQPLAAESQRRAENSQLAYYNTGVPTWMEQAPNRTTSQLRAVVQVDPDRRWREKPWNDANS